MPRPHLGIPVDVRQADDRFWRNHERHRQERISQPCCTLSGITAHLSRMPGNFCVVVHGERDCLNSFRSFLSPLSSRIYCTRLNEPQSVTGSASKVLGRCVRRVLSDKKPDLVFVLGTCLTELLGEDFEACLRGVSETAGIPILTLQTGGLKCTSEQAMLDMLWSRLADWSVAENKRRSRVRRVSGNGKVHIFGLPTSSRLHDELRRILGRCGLRLGSSFPGSASLDDWKCLALAKAAFVVDRSAYPLLTRRLEAAGLDVFEVPLPVGLKASQDFFDIVAGRFGRAVEVRRALSAEVAACRRSIAAFRKEFGARRLAYALRMGALYEADRLAYGGLGDLAFFTELGFKPTLLVQGAPGGKSRAFFTESLKRLGCRDPFLMFPDPYILPHLLKRGRFDLAYMSKNAVREAEQVGVPWMETRHLGLFFRGTLANVERVRKHLARIG